MNLDDMKVPTKDEYQEILKKSLEIYEGKQPYLVLRCMGDMGLRVSEALNIHVEMFDWKSDRVRIKSEKKRKEIWDWVYFPLELGVMLKDFIGYREERKVFDVSRRTVNNWIYTICKESGIEKKLSAHSFRHFFGTRIGRETKNPFLLRELMRHENIESTMIYVNISEKDKKEAIRRYIG